MSPRNALPAFFLCLPLFVLSQTEQMKKAHMKLDGEIQEARVLLNDKQYAAAEKAFDKLMTYYGNSANTKNLDPKVMPDIMLELQLAKVEALVAQRKVQEAATYAKGKRSAKPTPANHVLSAQAFLLERNRKASEESLKAAVKMDEEAFMAWFMLGRLSQAQRDDAKAIEYYKKSIEHNKTFSESRFFLGQIYLRKGNKKGVREHWNEYLKLIPRKGARYKLVNETLQKLGGA
ncbi:MAG: tetratricopeptide repeat protein [Acidobacteriota bacterium]|nr:tetratricopeptide repeat protein [Acidobacteriota bacterium]